MIKTKTAQIVDAQNVVSKVVFFDISHELVDNIKQTRTYNVVSLIEEVKEGNTILTPIKETKAIFKEATILNLFGTLTLADFKAQKDALLIGQIDYINSYQWTGTEAQDAPVRFWSLTSADLEIVI